MLLGLGLRRVWYIFLESKKQPRQRLEHPDILWI